VKQAQTKPGQRTPEQIREHYEIETELAGRLRDASKEERRVLYSSLYDEMFQRVPSHPQLTRKQSAEDTKLAVDRQMRFLRQFLTEDCVFMEIGPGDCALSFEAAKVAKQVYAIDVCDEISKSETTPDNFTLILSDGCSVPLPPESVDVAYSNQLMEHLHPDDALEQLREVFNALAPGGRYICITPNKLTGPHDVSCYFDDVATGFHLREYTICELTALFKAVGFSKVKTYAGARGYYPRFPATPLTLSERVLESLPANVRRPVAHSLPFRYLFLGVRLVATR
jgi:SAM-dependent methyltransferase